MIRILGILQARVSSSRLPAKALAPILGRPMLAQQLDRVRRARSLDALVVATSTAPSDDAIEALCASEGVTCFRGSLDDVLDRFYQAARAYAPQHVVRLTGDCPLIDPDLIDGVVAFALAGQFDFGGTDPKRVPDGLDVEVLRFAVLEHAWRQATRPSDREHVSLMILRQPDRFRIGLFAGGLDSGHLRLTVDEADDLELVRRIYAALYPRNPAFTTRDILDLLAAQPGLLDMNRGIERNEGLQRSIERDPREG